MGFTAFSEPSRPAWAACSSWSGHCHLGSGWCHLMEPLRDNLGLRQVLLSQEEPPQWTLSSLPEGCHIGSGCPPNPQGHWLKLVNEMSGPGPVRRATPLLSQTLTHPIPTHEVVQVPWHKGLHTNATGCSGLTWTHLQS